MVCRDTLEKLAVRVCLCVFVRVCACLIALQDRVNEAKSGAFVSEWNFAKSYDNRA